MGSLNGLPILIGKAGASSRLIFIVVRLYPIFLHKSVQVARLVVELLA